MLAKMDKFNRIVGCFLFFFSRVLQGLNSIFHDFSLKDDSAADFNSSENDEDVDLPGNICCFKCRLKEVDDQVSFISKFGFIGRKASVDYNYHLGRANNYLPRTLFVSRRQEFTPRVVRSRMCPRTNFRVYVRFISEDQTLYYMI